MGRWHRITRERSRWNDVHRYLAEQRDSREYGDVARNVTKRLTPDDTVLEMGCGCGLVTLRIAEEVGHVRAYDLVRPMLREGRGEAARAGIDNIDFVEGDVYQLEEPDGSFDSVICIYLLDVVENPTEVLREAHRLLRPGGKLMTVTDIFVGESRLRRRARQMKLALRGLLRGQVESCRPSAEQLRGWHERAGFEIRDTARWLVYEPLWNEFLSCVRADAAYPAGS